MSKVSDWIFSHRWAIFPGALEAIMEIVDRNMEISPIDLAKSLHGEMWKKYIDEAGNPIPVTFNALEAFNYPILEGTRRVSITEGVAILSVVGPLTPRNSFANSFTGGTSVQSLSYDFNIAVQDTSVDSIILSFDGPGGEITYISEFADQIYKARSKKPIIAYVGGMAASADYWLASAAEEIVIADTGEVGSIGVVAAYRDSSEAEKSRGIKRYEIVSSQSPNKRPDITTDKGRAKIQVIVDDLANVFIEAVAKYRGIEPKAVLENYGQGDMFVGQEAINRGLADRIGSLELLIHEQKAKVSTNFSGGIMNLTELQAKHPELYKEAVALGRSEVKAENEKALKSATTEAVDKERKRIEAIEALSAPGFEDLITEGKKDPDATAESVSKKILEAQKVQREKMAEDLGKDGKELESKLDGVGNSQGSEEGGEKSALVSTAVSAMNEGR